MNRTTASKAHTANTVCRIKYQLIHMTLAADEFIRRFLLHTLPDGFHRIRHYGFLANRQRAAKLALCRRLLDAPSPEPSAERVRDAVAPCPSCGGAMVVLGVLARPAPCRASFWDDTS